MFVRQMYVSEIDQVYELALRSLDEDYVRDIFFFFISSWPAGQLVAVNEIGDVIGFLSGARLTQEKVAVALFAVNPRYRRAGVGSKLMEEFGIRAMMDGKRYIQLEVKDSNEAMFFYEKIGFVPIELLSNFYSDGASAVRMMRSVRGDA